MKIFFSGSDRAVNLNKSIHVGMIFIGKVRIFAG